MHVNYAYLHQQFAEVEDYFVDLREFVASGEFTLGPYVERFERKFADYIGVRHAIGVNTGTDALILALEALGVGHGDEVITVPNTFIATVGAIVAVGAKPVFVDCDERLQIDANQIAEAITANTKAIIPVHWAGCPADIGDIMAIAAEKGVAVVEDACPSAGAAIDGKKCGSFGRINAFSMHPLKPLNVWGDGGIIVTDDDGLAEYLRLYQNHGLQDRDHVEIWGVNRRLQPFQAVVAMRLMDQLDKANELRERNARLLDSGLQGLDEFISYPPRPAGYTEVYQLYIALAKKRDELLAYLNSRDIECKIHYPIPIHLQKAAASLGYKMGDFPRCEQQCKEIITLPAHQYITDEQIAYMLQCIKDFYQRNV
jgi:dTDP-3-amino-2,3,6-trideoxy-4-keto-D-glucose/dTDP-3-amino-3,4,6-trideoxy-alpha-D-glucose/dTDP-2,6-dideoxy-D-kanosamine transaminase